MSLPITKEELETISDPDTQRKLRARATRLLKRGFYGEALWIYQKIFREAMRTEDREEKLKAIKRSLKDVEKLRAYGSNLVAAELLRDILVIADEMGYKSADKLFKHLVDLWLSGIHFEIRRTLYYFEESYIWIHHDSPNLKVRMQKFFETNFNKVKALLSRALGDIISAIKRKKERKSILPELEKRLNKLSEMIFYLGDFPKYKKIKDDLERKLKEIQEIS